MISPINIDAKAFGKVAVLLGGNSAEREVSLASGESILQALISYGVDAHSFDTKFRPICELQSENYDRVFIALHGRGGEDGTIQGALQQMSMPYTGSGVTGSALSIDKVLSKLIWQARNLPSADYIVANKQTFFAEDAQKQANDIMNALGNKVMVKPSLEGSSLGMAIAPDTQSLLDALNHAFTFDENVLIERFINGPEYTVSILGKQALPSISMRSASGFYDYHAKYKSNTTQYDCPSDLDEHEENYIRSLALQAFDALHGKGWGRVDLMRDSAKNNPNAPMGFYLLESNTVPGMTKTSLVPKAAKQAGLDFEQLVMHILAQTLDSYIGETHSLANKDDAK